MSMASGCGGENGDGFLFSILMTESKPKVQESFTVDSRRTSDAVPAPDLEIKTVRALLNDKPLIRAGIACFVVMMLSWALQWVAYALPYWRGDIYHHGGFFEICGDRDFDFNFATGLFESGRPTNWTCTSVEEYADKIGKLFINDTVRYNEVMHAKNLIGVSKILEALSTIVDMFFGLTTIWAITFPHQQSKNQLSSIYFCIFGVALAPVLCIIDMVFQFHYWEVLGIGSFNYDQQTGMYFSGDVSVVATAVDLIIQLWFMNYGIKREGILRQEAYDAGKLEADTASNGNAHELDNMA
ncbi:UNVERIFIED_CONTAM: hypothetical protein HDU68_012153 [Siphonaria sp. JEL0065]|nr:hypothetical protein HDU68_012153 [Siphonaria sp. JEL0065]